MNRNEHELVIQRCVDNELNDADRQALMQRLDADQEGWRLLACAFMEEQLFERAIRSEDTPVRPQRLHAPQVETLSAAGTAAGWFHHPAVSVVLSACIAFVAGLLVPWSGLTTNPRSSEALVASPHRPSQTKSDADLVATQGTKDGTRGDSTIRTEPDWQVQLMPTGVSAQPVDVPVYENARDYLSVLTRLRQQQQRPDDPELSHIFQQPHERSMRFVRVPVGDRLILIPIEEFSFGPEVQ